MEDPDARQGFLKCQIDISELLLVRHRELMKKLQELRVSISQTEGLLAKRDRINEFSRLSGEIENLKWVADSVAALSYVERGSA